MFEKESTWLNAYYRSYVATFGKTLIAAQGVTKERVMSDICKALGVVNPVDALHIICLSFEVSKDYPLYRPEGKHFKPAPASEAS